MIGKKRVVLAVAVALIGALAIGAPALADDTTAVAKAKDAVTKRIDLRLAALHRDDAALTGAKRLTDAHQSTLHDLVTADISGLTSLKTKVAGETTLAALKADAQSMVNDYRIFILVGPTVRLTIAGDTEDAATAKLRTVHDTLAGLVATAKAGGADTAAAEQNLADMSAALDKVGTDTSGLVAGLLAVQPGPDGAAIKAKVDSVRSGLIAGRADLHTAISEAKQVRAFLRSLPKK